MSAESKRRYRKRKRAESEEETRRRITEAAVELHGTVGPANTTVTELAELAGVSRMTVYNHFPSDAELMAACSSHWIGEHPSPDPVGWAVVTDPAERLELALGELYGWFDRGRDMLTNILRDAPVVPALGDIMDPWWGGYMDQVVSALSHGWSDDPVLRITLRVVVDFNTWRLLNAAGLANDAAARLAADMVVCGKAERGRD